MPANCSINKLPLCFAWPTVSTSGVSGLSNEYLCWEERQKAVASEGLIHYAGAMIRLLAACATAGGTIAAVLAGAIWFTAWVVCFCQICC